jgi:DNA helicase-2/ATP-dependent DNA helicase PcrA
LALEGVEPSKDAIQILTIHTAKGLEWDVVVVPGVREGNFPASGRGDENWLESIEVIPFPLRGDRDRLPTLTAAASFPEFRTAMEEFEVACDRRGLTEEERLAYVAVTRPKHALLVTSSWWANASTLRGPSPIFTAAREVMPSAFLHDEPEPEDGRGEVESATCTWPIDPLGSRRATLEARAGAVMDASGEVQSALGREWLQEAEVLLAERREVAGGVALPQRLSVSALVQLRSDPDQLARRLRRPMPFKPDPLARRGTAFHRWLEERFHAQALFDLDEFSDDDVAEVGLADLALLQERWLASEWAGRDPLEIEVPFDHAIDGILIRGRMDAVYRDGDRWEVVDWKTGPPKTARDLEAAAVQLAMYRLAWSRMVGVPIEQVSAAFHHVAANVTVRPSDLLDEAGLIALIRSIPLNPSLSERA